MCEEFYDTLYVFVGDDDGNSNIGSDDDGNIPDSRVYYPGETISGEDHEYYHKIKIDGNDPYFERLDAAQEFVGTMNDSKDRMSVVRFWGAGSNERAKTKISQSTDFDAVNETLDKNTAAWESSGGTPMLKALNAGISEVKTDMKRDGGKDVTETVVLLTDGRPSDDSEENLDDIRDAAEDAHEDGIRIYVVALGDEGDYNKELLEDIANVDGENPDRVGKVYEVEDANNLADAFEEAATDSQETTERIVEYKNSTTSVNVGGSVVDFGTNTNDPSASGYQSIDVDSSLEAGDLVHFAVTTRQCADYEPLGAVNDSSDVQNARCQGTSGTANETTNDASTKHQIFMDGDDIPSLEASAWYMTDQYEDNSVTEIVEAYNASFTDGGQFDLPQNDAIILVEIDDDDANSDFMVLYFDASRYDPSEDEVSPSDVPTDDTPSGSTAGTQNGYVIDVDTNDVNVSSGSPSLALRSAFVNYVHGPLGSSTTAGMSPSVAASVRD